LVEGVHFLPGASAHSLGHRALAVNLSDIAAMGAAPCWALLSLNLPAADESWLQAFAQGFGALARQHQVALVGGNLSRGPLSITVEMAGVVPVGQALRRDGARSGDLLYVSGTVGDAAQSLLPDDAGLLSEDERAYLRARLEYPSARVALGQGLRGLASACIDVSDGLYADAMHLLQASGCHADIDLMRLPLSSALQRVAGTDAWQAGLRGGEDYELCFAAAGRNEAQIEALARQTGQSVARIGTLGPGSGITLKADGAVIQFSASGFDHFRD
jgi:thiamine-monophosphate kinase